MVVFLRFSLEPNRLVRLRTGPSLGNRIAWWFQSSTRGGWNIYSEILCRGNDQERNVLQGPCLVPIFPILVFTVLLLRF